MGYPSRKDSTMPINNTALFDAALATIADSNGAWITYQTTSRYVAQANAAVAVATEIDAAIPAVPGGATISQRNLLVAITKSVMEGRSPTNTSPSTYAAIAASIAAMFAEYKTRLLNTDVSGAGGLFNLSTVLFVDNGTIVPGPSQNGNIESPFATIAAGIAAASSSDTLFLTQGSYFTEGLITVNKLLYMRGFGGDGSLALLTLTAGITVQCEDVSVVAAVTVPATSFFYGKKGTLSGGISGNGGINLRDMTVTVGITAATLFADNCTIVGDIHLSDVNCSFTQCTLAGTPTITFTGAAGTITMDGFTYDKWLTGNGTVVNGKIKVINSLPNATVPVTVPALVVGELGYVNVSVASTDLVGIEENTPIAAGPTDDLAAGGTGSPGFFINARVSATNTVRFAFMGQFDSPQTVDFNIVQLDAK
jgi:hypothetical protein